MIPVQVPKLPQENRLQEERDLDPEKTFWLHQAVLILAAGCSYARWAKK